jgi:replicative DNA helicase
VEGALCYDLNIRMANRNEIFTLPRQVDRVPMAENREPRLTIKSIEYIGEQKTQCISVSHPSRLFITDDFIVTHNSSTLTNLCLRLPENNDNLICLMHTVDDASSVFVPRLFGSKYPVDSNIFMHAGYHLKHNTQVRPFGGHQVPFRDVFKTPGSGTRTY